jgi:LPS export ABC transporter protein LptC
MVREEKILLKPDIPLWRMLIISGVSAFFLFMISSCGNDVKTVNAITLKVEGPDMSAMNIEVIFSDSGKLEAKLTSILLNKYEGQNPYLEFPKGFKVLVYDSLQRVESTITGNYGRQDELTRVMVARGNVVVRNELKNQQINTEELTWIENRRLISSDVKVKITTENKVLYSDGLKANDSFTWYELVNPRGQMTVDQDSI